MPITYIDSPVTYQDEYGVSHTVTCSCFTIGEMVFEVPTGHLDSSEIQAYLQELVEAAQA